MEHRLMLVVSVVSLLFIPGCGGSDGNGFTPEADAQTTSENVTVTNNPLNVNITNTSLPLAVTTEPVITIEMGNSRQVIGLDEACDPGGAAVSIYTVPSGKTFILTDATGHVGTFEGTILRQIGSTSTTVLRFDSNARDYHFQSGYDFPSGSQIVWSSNPGGFCVNISGYLIAS